MKNKIKNNIENPEQLENIYQVDKKGFEKAFFDIYPEIAEHKMAGFWKARLNYDNQKDSRIKYVKTDVIFLVITCLIIGLLIKIPKILNIDPDEYFFYERNAGLIALMGLSVFLFLTKKQFKLRNLFLSGLVFIISAAYINLLPYDKESHSIILAYIHLPLVLWGLFGLIFIDFDTVDLSKRINYIRYNGDLAILGAVILIAGGILAIVTFALFSSIEIDIEKFYFDYIVIIGVVCAPVVATYILRLFPSLTNKIAPIIASIFSPLVLLTLVIYLFSIVITGKNPYNDRDFLLVFNLLLLGVMAIMVFSVSETSVIKNRRFNEFILFALSIITLIVNMIALSAIVYRLGQFGITPNRVAVLGSNLLVFVNLVLIMIDLFKVIFKGSSFNKLEMTIAKYLPVYLIWTVFVTFLLPFIFRFG